MPRHAMQIEMLPGFRVKGGEMEVERRASGTVPRMDPVFFMIGCKLMAALQCADPLLCCRPVSLRAVSCPLRRHSPSSV